MIDDSVTDVHPEVAPMNVEINFISHGEEDSSEEAKVQIFKSNNNPSNLNKPWSDA